MIYKITLGQLITIWIFGLFGWVIDFFSMSSYGDNFVRGMIFILIPFVLIFYTLGWRKVNKKNSHV